MKNSITPPFDVKALNYLSTFFFTIFGCLIVINFVTFYMANSPINLKKIIIHGDLRHQNTSSVRANVIPGIRGNFFTINLNDTQLAFESLPWIRNAVVKRIFPNQLEIHLKEYRPVAVWGAQEDSKMISADGVVFDSSADDDEYEKLPQFIGSDEQSRLMLEVYTKLITILRPLKVKLVKIALSSRGSWTAVLEGGAQIELGRGSLDIITERMKQFADTFDMAASNFNKDITALQYADLRHADGYALRMNGVTTIDHSTNNKMTKK